MIFFFAKKKKKKKKGWPYHFEHNFFSEGCIVKPLGAQWPRVSWVQFLTDPMADVPAAYFYIVFLKTAIRHTFTLISPLSAPVATQLPITVGHKGEKQTHEGDTRFISSIAADNLPMFQPCL